MSNPENEDDIPDSGPPLLSFLLKRKAMYEEASANAKTAGDSRKERRMERGIKILAEMCKKVEDGGTVEKKNIPPRVPLGTSTPLIPQPQVNVKQPAPECNPQSGLETNQETDTEPVESVDGHLAPGTNRNTGSEDDSSEPDEDMRSGDAAKRRDFDVTLLFAETDTETADRIMNEMTENIQLKSGKRARVVFYDDPAFGGNIVCRPSIICEKSIFIFILNPENLGDDNVADFTKDETIAHTRILCLCHKSDTVMPLLEGDDLHGSIPVAGLAAVPPIYWNMSDESTKSLSGLLQCQLDEEGRQNNPALETYEMKAKRGICLIINNIKFERMENGAYVKNVKLNRKSAEWESDRLREILEGFGYEVWSKKNRTDKEMEGLINDVSEIDHEEYDSFVCFLLSHGGRDVIYGSNLVGVPLQSLFATVMQDNCPSLKGKPKLFFIDACRTEYFGVLDAMKCFFGNSEESDSYICYAASPGEPSQRSSEKGDWFTQEFIETIKTRSRSSDLIGIMHHVEHQISKRSKVDTQGERRTQKPEIINRLTKKFYFEKRTHSCSKYNDEHDQPQGEKRSGGEVPIRPSKPAQFYDLALDIMGPFKDQQKASRRFILILTDTTTQWIEAEILLDDTSGTVMECLMKFMCRYGMPRSYITCSDPDFSRTIQTVCEHMGIEHQPTACDPSLQGKPRLYNGKLCSLISAFVRHRPNDWDVKLPYLLLVYRTSLHEEIHTDPFQQLFGRQARLPEGVDARDPVPGDSKESSIIKKVDVLITNTEKVRQRVDSLNLDDKSCGDHMQS